METELKSGLKWKEVIDILNNSNILEAKFTERTIKKKKRPNENLKGDTLFIKRKDANYKTVYRKNIKEDKEKFLDREVKIDVLEYINTNLTS